MDDLTFTTQSSFLHHGIEGQKWGVRNGPPYPLDKAEKRRIRKENKQLIKQKKQIDKDQKLILKNEALKVLVNNKDTSYEDIKNKKFEKANRLLDKALNAGSAEFGKKAAGVIGAAAGTILAKEIKDLYNEKRGSFDLSKPRSKDIKVGEVKRKFWYAE